MNEPRMNWGKKNPKLPKIKSIQIVLFTDTRWHVKNERKPNGPKVKRAQQEEIK